MDSPRKPQYIPLRVGYIKDLLKDIDLKFLIDFDNHESESFLNTYIKYNFN